MNHLHHLIYYVKVPRLQSGTFMAILEGYDNMVFITTVDTYEQILEIHMPHTFGDDFEQLIAFLKPEYHCSIIPALE